MGLNGLNFSALFLGGKLIHVSWHTFSFFFAVPGLCQETSPAYKGEKERKSLSFYDIQTWVKFAHFYCTIMISTKTIYKGDIANMNHICLLVHRTLEAFPYFVLTRGPFLWKARFQMYIRWNLTFHRNGLARTCLSFALTEQSWHGLLVLLTSHIERLFWWHKLLCIYRSLRVLYILCCVVIQKRTLTQSRWPASVAAKVLYSIAGGNAI